MPIVGPESFFLPSVYYYSLCTSNETRVWTGIQADLRIGHFFQRSHVCTWQCCTLKCSATHPAFSPVRNISRLFYFIFLLCQNQFQLRHSRQKWWPLTAWTWGWWISQLIVGESTLRSGACFGTFLQLHFQSSLQQVHDENSEENERKRNDLHTPIPVSPLDLCSPHSGKYRGESFFCDYLNVWILWLSAFIWSPAQWKSAWTDAGKLTEHFDTKYGWIEDDCGKSCRQKLGLLGCPFRLYTYHDATCHGCTSDIISDLRSCTT